MIDKIRSNDLRSEQLTENNFQEVKNFNSFERELVDFLLKDALKNQEMHISTTHLWFYKPSNELAGYITLLTDRISLLPAQKEIFKKKAQEGEIRFVIKGTIRPSWEEIKTNPRARSAKLKIVEKI